MDKRTKILIAIVAMLALCVALTGCVSTGALASSGEGSASVLLGTARNESALAIRTFKFHTSTLIGDDEEYVITIDATGVTDDPAYMTDSNGNKVLKINKVGYEFQGWFFTSTYSGERVVFPYTPDADDNRVVIELYAKWVLKTVHKISNAEELAQISKAPDGNYILTADIDLSGFDRFVKDTNGNYKYAAPRTTDGVETEDDKVYNEAHRNAWVPICGGVGEAFSGTFDGNGHRITNMSIVITSEDQDEEFNYLPVGLFGKVTGSVVNVVVDNVKTSDSGDVSYTKFQIDGDCSRFYIGAVAGWVAEGGRVNNCTFIGRIVNPVLEYESTIWDDLFGSYAEPTEDTYVGGVVGYLNGGTVTACSSEGEITSESNADNVYIGGVVGNSAHVLDDDKVKISTASTVTSSNSSMRIKARYAGGLVGYNNGDISMSFAIGNTEGSLSYPAIAGGLVAYNYTHGTISRCYAEGNVSARTAGGLVGVNVFDYATAAGGTISNAYAGGNVFASEFAGGLIGRAVANLPVNGRDGYSDKIFNMNDNKSSSDNTFFIITACMAYGDVEANATKTTFKDYNGVEYSADIYYPVYAGSVIGQAHELLVRGCIGFGTVKGVSNRPKVTVEGVSETESVYNSAFAENFVGQSSNKISGKDYINVFVAESVTVTRNDMTVVEPGYEGTEKTFTSYNPAPTVTFAQLNNSRFYEQQGFSGSYWYLDGLNVEAGIRPTLRLQ